MAVNVKAQRRPLSTIAEEIYETWSRVHPHAKPYLDAMYELNLITDNFHEDDAEGVVLRFLNNAKGWRGDDAKRIKAELRAMVTK